MKTTLQTFDFNTHALRVITDENGEPWFIAKDVAEILDYSDAYKMISRLDDDEKSNRQISGLGSPTGGRGTLTISESGLYSAILGSNKPEAKAFKKHVTSEVLPSIRKTGDYSADSMPYGLKARIADTLTLAEFVAYQEQLTALNEQLLACNIVMTAQDCLKLDLNKTLAKIQREDREKQEDFKIADTIIQMEFEGKPRYEIVKAVNRNFNAVRQVIFQARRDGLLPPAKQGGAA